MTRISGGFGSGRAAPYVSAIGSEVSLAYPETCGLTAIMAVIMGVDLRTI